MFSGKDILRGDDAILHDALLVVNVVQEKVERGDALRQSPLDDFPFVRGNNARDQIERKDALGAARVAIDVEGHALTQKREVHGMPPAVKLVAGKFPKQVVKFAVVRKHIGAAIDHLVEEGSAVVAVEQAAREFRF